MRPARDSEIQGIHYPADFVLPGLFAQMNSFSKLVLSLIATLGKRKFYCYYTKRTNHEPPIIRLKEQPPSVPFCSVISSL
jgi:hypothetical protein